MLNEKIEVSALWSYIRLLVCSCEFPLGVWNARGYIPF